MKLEELLKIDTKEKEMETEAKIIMENLSELGLEINEELFHRLNLNYNIEVHEYLKKMDTL